MTVPNIPTTPTWIVAAICALVPVAATLTLFGMACIVLAIHNGTPWHVMLRYVFNW